MIRTRFVWALASTIVGGGVVVSAPAVSAEYEGGKYDREGQQARREVEALLAMAEPARVALGKPALPDGMAPCAPPRHDPVPLGLLCAEGRGDVLDASRALLTGLAEVGATGIEPRCVTVKRIGQQCILTADLHGQVVRLGVQPRPGSGPADPWHGADIQGGVGPFIDSESFGIGGPIALRGTPVDLGSPAAAAGSSESSRRP